MAEAHVITALVRKRSELAGEIEHLHDQLRQRIIDLDNVDATIRLFDPDMELEEIKPKPFPPRHAAVRGEVSRVVLTSLRNADGPLTTADLAQRLMAERGLDTADKRLMRVIAERVGSALCHYRQNGMVRSAVGPGWNFV